MRKKFVIRRTTEGQDRASSSYVVDRSQPVGRGLGGGYRFAKTAVSNATLFDESTARKVMSSLKRSDNNKDISTYTLVQW